MFLNESLWIRDVLARAGLTPGQVVLDVGSSTEAFRCFDRPYIDFHVFRPLRKAGLKILHLDAKADEGVDIVCDITSTADDALDGIPRGDIVLCSNLLEHVEDRALVCRHLVELTNPGGILVITVPFVYRWHPDPIDTMYRPSARELETLFSGPGFHVLASAEIVVDEEPVLLPPSFLARLVNRVYRQLTWKVIFPLRQINNQVSAIALRKLA